MKDQFLKWFIILEKICCRMKNKLLLIIVFISLSCSDYRNYLKQEGYEKNSRGLKYYEEEYYKASTLFEDILLVKGTEKSEIVDFYFAYCLYHQKQYI